LTPENQASVLRVVDGIPDKFRVAWKVRFEENRKAPPTAEDERTFEATTERDTLWSWRAVLPAERREALERIASEQGEPGAWMNPLFFAVEESPLTGQQFSALSATDIVEFLKTWKPTEALQNQTVTALAQELQTAAGNDPKAYARIADQLIDVRPVYIRHLFNGLKGAAANGQIFEWANALKLVKFTYSQFGQSIDPTAATEGDDHDLSWACAAASELLLAGLRRGEGGIGFEHAAQLRSLALRLTALAPKQPEIEDFEERYGRDSFFAAQATLRGLAVELCILVFFC
jgi:hypothetical protein